MFWLSDLDCRGNETHLGQCGSAGWGSHNCQYDEAVGIACGEQKNIKLRNFLND